MRLIVHAGPGKTGSTAIQKSLLKANESLRANGILYLGLMLEHSPVKAYEWQRPGGFDGFSRLPENRQIAELDALFRSTLTEASQLGMDTIVLSNESLLRRGGVFRRVLRTLVDDGVDLQAVAYVRGYGALLRSAYVQWGIMHKTYAGPLRDFDTWMRGREIALSPSIEKWQAELGSSFSLRNFDTCQDVVGDFLACTGLTGKGVVPIRTYETPGSNEILLRALFNALHPGPIGPSRFNKLFEVGKIDFQRPPEDVLAGLMPTGSQVSRVLDELDSEQAKINGMLDAAGQPHLPHEPKLTSDMSIDSGALIVTLFQMLALQALRVDALQEELRQYNQSVTSAGSFPGIAVDSPIDADRARALAPALGYFGATNQDLLQVPLPAAVRELRLSIAEERPTFLNLRALEFRRDGKPLVIKDVKVRASQSSISGPSQDATNAADGLLAKSGIHTAAESAPWWLAQFEPAVEADALYLWNRSDGWGSRSRTLAIDMVDTSGNSRRLYQGMSVANLSATLVAAAKAAGVAPTMLPSSTDAASRLRGDLLQKIASRLHAGLNLEKVEWREIVALVDVWASHEPDASEWAVIAAFLLAQHRAKGPTSIKAFSLMLDSKTKLLTLQSEINRLAEERDWGSFMLTRHGVKAEGLLRKDPYRFLDHLQAVLAALEGMGRTPLLAYGTLLGAVREGNFIAHDDDIDLLYRSDACNRDEVEADLLVLKEALRAAGFKVVDLLPNSLNMHVIDPRTGAVMDVFPCWEESGRLQMHMEGMKIRGIDKTIVYPASVTSLLDRSFPAPARPEDFLQERYGDGWRISDQFFEWPWPLKGEEGQ